MDFSDHKLVRELDFPNQIQPLRAGIPIPARTKGELK